MLQEIMRSIKTLCKENEVYELRIVKAGRNKKSTFSGYYSDLNELAKEADRQSDIVPAVYITLNPVPDAFLARANNRLEENPAATTSDGDVKRRYRILIDCDCSKASGISSSNEEHEAALTKCVLIRDWLTSLGFPLPIYADSGNGGHLIYGIDLPNNDESTELIKRFLEAIATRFDDSDQPISIHVDTTVFNAARISKVYGTMVRKGDDIPKRPHRLSKIISSPDKLETVPLALLEAIAGISSAGGDSVVEDAKEWLDKARIKPAKPSTQSTQAGPHTVLSVTRILNEKRVPYLEPVEYQSGHKWVLEQCPSDMSHGSDSAIFLFNGWVSWKCFHNGCQGENIDTVFPGWFGKPKNDDQPAKKPTAEETAGKYEKIAAAFAQVVDSQNPLFVDRIFYLWNGCKYEQIDDLDLRVRCMCADFGWSQSNNVIGNVTPIIEAKFWKKGKQLPFWDGDDQPFKNVKDIISYKNGLLDIKAEQPKLTPHTSKWCSTFCLPFGYEPAATCPRWHQFLKEVFPDDVDRAALLQEFFGYCLTQDTSLQKALVLVGKPRSGKGTILKVLNQLVGEDNSTAYSLDSMHKDFGLSPLVGKTLALIGEVELSNHPQRAKITEVLKSVIGEDPQSINRKHQAEMPSVRLGVRFVIGTNTVPRLMDSSGALAYRLLFIPFQESFMGREDTDLEQKLIQELPGIANWAMAGLARLRSNSGKFTLGQYHKESSDQFAADTSPTLSWIRESMLVSKWANSGDMPSECLSDDPNLSIGKKEAYLEFTEWNNSRGLLGKTETWFFTDIKTVLPKLTEAKVTNSLGKRELTYKGLATRSQKLVDNRPI